MTKIISVRSVELQMADGHWVWLGAGQLRVDPVALTIVFDAPWSWPAMLEGASVDGAADAVDAVDAGFWAKLLDALGWQWGWSRS